MIKIYLYFHFLINTIDKQEFICQANSLSSIVNIECIETFDKLNKDVYISIVEINDNNILGICENNIHKNDKLYNKNIYLNSILKNEELYITFKHEFAHFLGLEHSIDEKSLMYPIKTKEEFLSRYDSLHLKLLFKK